MECATSSSLSTQVLPLSCSGLRRSPLAYQLKWAAPKRSCLKKRRAFTNAQFELKPPPYSLDALEPHMSCQTLEYHWGKHHRTYLDNLNKQIAGTELDGMSLEEIIVTTYNNGYPLPPFNNAAQAWNHDFFWDCMKPGGGGLPTGSLLELIERDFGSYDTFYENLRQQQSRSLGLVGLGFAVSTTYDKANRLAVGNAVNPCPTEKDDKLVITKGPNAVNPLIWDYSPLLTVDVWEHAYYLDFENKRPEYVSTFMEKLVSWEAVTARLEIAKAKAAERAREEEERRRKEEEADELESSEPVEMYLDSEPEGIDSE